MRLQFNRIHLHNFFSFEDTELDLRNMGYAMVSGKNMRSVDNSQSNGSGKSSIFNGIFYALTGETSQGLKNKIENIYSDPNDCWVELDLNVNDDHFIIRRIKTPYSNMQIYMNDVNISGKGIKESTKVLSEYIPDLNSMLIGSIIILGQGLPYRFADNHPGGRKELLEKLTKSDYLIQTIRDKLDYRQQELRLLLRTHEDTSVSIDTQINIYEGQLKRFNDELEEYKVYENIDKRLEEIHIGISDCLSNMGRFSSEKSKYEKKLNDFNNTRTESLNGYYTQLEKDTAELRGEIDKLKSSSISLRTEIRTLEDEIKRLDSVVDVCPTCGQKLIGVHKVNTTSQKNVLSLKNIQLNNIELNLKTKEDEYKKFCDESKKSFDETLKSLSDENETNLTSFKDYDLKLNKVNKTYNDLLKEELKLKNMLENYNKIKQGVNTSKNKLRSLYRDKDEITKNISSDNEHLQVIQSLITLTKREFRGILLENVIKYMNDKMKQLSKIVFNNELLSFELNENYIDIMYDGKYYESLSGGEKQKIDIIIQLTLRELLSNQLNVHSNILVVDEIFDNLDAVGCQGILNLISNINDIESVFIISHHVQDLQISYDVSIDVTKSESGISTISVH